MKKATNWYIVVVLVAIAVGGYALYQYAFKSGYSTGTKNQIICQASEAQESLKPLCNK